MKNFIIIMILFTFGYVPAYLSMTNPMRRFLGPRLVAAFALTTLAGFFMPSTLLFFACLALLVLCTARDRLGAGCQYVLLAGLIVQVNFGWDIGGHFIGFVDQLVIIGLAAFAIARSKSKPLSADRRSLLAEDWLILTTFLIMTVGGYGFSDVNTTLRAFVGQALLILLPYFLMRYTLRSTDDYRRAIACFGFSGILLSVFAMYEAHFGWSIFEAINYHLGSSALSKNMLTRGSHLRAPATMSGPLALASYLTMGLIALLCSRDFFRSRAAYWAALGVTFIGLLAAQSRGSLIALAAAMVILCLAWRRWGLAAFLVGGAAAGALTLVTAARFIPSLAAFLNINQPSAFEGYYDYRQLLFDKGVEQIHRHPFTGMRLQPVLDALASIKQGEDIVDLVNVYLVILLISGLAGFIPFVALVARSFWSLVVRFRRVTDRHLLTVRAFCMAGFTVMLIQFGFMSFIDRIPMLFALVVVGARVVKLERRSAVQALRRDAPQEPSAGRPDTSLVAV